MTNGLPKTLDAFAYFLYRLDELDIVLNDLVHLRRNVSNTGWDGHVTRDADQMRVNVMDMPGGIYFGLEVELWHDELLVDTAGWSHTQPADVERWDTGTKLTIHQPGYREASLHVMG